MNVLIVDDFVLNRELLAQLFPPNTKCDLVESGKNALAVIGHVLQTPINYDLICLDLVMPEMDGFDVLEKIRLLEEQFKSSLIKKSKILVVTSKKDSKTVSKAIQLGCDGYLSKPFNRRSLMMHLERLRLI